MLTTLAYFGGWAAVAQRYRCRGTPVGKSFHWQCARFGWVDYNGCVSIRVCADGLRLATFPLFRPGHPPLFIPWSALRVVSVNDKWWGRYTVVDVGAPTIAQVRLPLKVMDEARRLTPS